MDLAQYKKVWKGQPKEANEVSTLEIYKMTQSKSTSIVKWIFIVGLLEFTFFLVLNLILLEPNYNEIFGNVNLTQFINFSYYFNYLVVALFLIIFYRNYVSVSTVDDTKTLMKKIIKVRKTVKFYIFYNVFINILMLIIYNIIIFNSPDTIKIILSNYDMALDESQMMTVYIISQVIAVVMILLFLFLLYYLLYGTLLKKLKKNYKELTL
ncbi:MAG: hypothetical protein MK076_04460 [Flavobacteriales bacterium]|nr:hypothetical protein [Flavobacteriales bacterium]